MPLQILLGKRYFGVWSSHGPMVQGQDPLTLNSGLDVEVERVEDRLVSLVRKVSRATVRCTSHTSHA